jgi:hypothetical protein
LTTTKESARRGRRGRIGSVVGKRDASRDWERRRCRSNGGASGGISERKGLRRSNRRGRIYNHGTAVNPGRIVGVGGDSIVDIVLNNSLRDSTWRRLDIGREKRTWGVG